jgi:hypothetical protein
LAETSSWTRAESDGQRALEVRHRRQKLVFDGDVGERVFGDVSALGHHNGDWLANMANFAARQRHLGSSVENRGPQWAAAAPAASPVSSSRRGHRRRRRQPHPAAPGPATDRPHPAWHGRGAAQEGDVQHPSPLDIVDRQRPAREQAAVLIARDRGARWRVVIASRSSAAGPRYGPGQPSHDIEKIALFGRKILQCLINAVGDAVDSRKWQVEASRGGFGQHEIVGYVVFLLARRSATDFGAAAKVGSKQNHRLFCDRRNRTPSKYPRQDPSHPYWRRQRRPNRCLQRL